MAFTWIWVVRWSGIQGWKDSGRERLWVGGTLGGRDFGREGLWKGGNLNDGHTCVVQWLVGSQTRGQIYHDTNEWHFRNQTSTKVFKFKYTQISKLVPNSRTPVRVSMVIKWGASRASDVNHLRTWTTKSPANSKAEQRLRNIIISTRDTSFLRPSSFKKIQRVFTPEIVVRLFINFRFGRRSAVDEQTTVAVDMNTSSPI